MNCLTVFSVSSEPSGIESSHERVSDMALLEDVEPHSLMLSAFCVRGKDESCEDACFVCNRGVGVADGVSGWREYGLDSSKFSKELMRNAKQEICRSHEKAQKEPKETLNRPF